MGAPALAARPDTAAALARVAKALAMEVRLDRLLPLIVEQATAVLEAERSSFFRYDRARGELRSVVAEGAGELRFDARAGLAGHVLRTRRPLNLPDAYADPRFNPALDRETGFRTHSVLSVPVVDRAGEPLGVLQVLNKRGGTFSAADEALLGAFSAHAAVALERAMLVEGYVEQQRMREALRLAREVQAAMLPEEPPPPGIDLAAHLAPAAEVGGDLYDYFETDAHRLGFTVGDVVGKGVPAALHMAGTHTLLRAFGQQGLAPADCLDRIARTQRGAAATFVTLFYGVLDVRTGALAFCNAGHHPPALVRAGGEATLLGSVRNLPLCRLSRPHRPETTKLAPGDLLVLYTDGVVEATDGGGELFGEARLLDVLRETSAAPANVVVQHTLAALDAFTGSAPPHDDLTLLALRFLGA